MPMKRVTQAQLIALLRKKQGDRPAYRLAKDLGISASYLSDIYRGRRYAGPSVLGKLGLERSVEYETATP